MSYEFYGLSKSSKRSIYKAHSCCREHTHDFPLPQRFHFLVITIILYIYIAGLDTYNNYIEGKDHVSFDVRARALVSCIYL